VLDVGINKTFKTNCRRQFERWLEVHAEGSKPHRKNAAMWAAQAWSQVTTKTIKKTRNHIGYFNLPIEDIDTHVDHNNNVDDGMEITQEDIAGDEDIYEDVIGGTESENSASDDDDFIDEPAIVVRPKKRTSMIIENNDHLMVANDNNNKENEEPDMNIEVEEEFDEASIREHHLNIQSSTSTYIYIVLC
jgi:hypothetical protein